MSGDLTVTVAGAGLAGCEAAWAAANAGAAVTLIDMKPGRRTPAHQYDGLAELVCSNSLKAARVDSAAGLLKEEMRRLGSVCLQAAADCAVPAGGALAVDRRRFSDEVTARIRAHPRIALQRREIAALDELAGGAVIVATGPLTSEPLAGDIARLCGGRLAFFDAAAPVVDAAGVDMAVAFRASRYGDNADEGTGSGPNPGDYINCPMNKEEYEAFHDALVHARTAPLHGVDGDYPVYEGCMPIEALAARGPDAPRFGPMKPVGLRDPRTGRRPWAVVQLRAENAGGTMLNLVGFQTNLAFGEQRRVFGMIPGLRDAPFLRYGVMHRNTFIDSPRLLDATYRFTGGDNLYFAGQLTGVEGYMESAASGILAGLNAVRRLTEQPPLALPQETMTGALAAHISDPTVTHFQPMGANMGLLPPLEPPVRDKRERYAALARRALQSLDTILNRS